MNDVIVSAEQGTSLVATIKMGNQTAIIDESGLETGEDTGPKPMDYIMSALGSCTVITLQMYAQRKNWPLERAEVRLQQRPLTEAEGALEPNQNKRTLIVKTLHLTGNLSQEQIIRLKDISARCPIQKTLEAGMAIQTILE